MEGFSVTLLIIILTAITSILAFGNPAIRGTALFYPYAIRERNEWFRFITSGFIHADFLHLAVNMFVLYMFGETLEKIYLPAFFGSSAKLVYIAIYLLGMVVSDIPSYFKHRHDPTYRGLGASGAVAAVLFAVILIGPFTGAISLMLIPIPMPPIVFGVLYLIYSAYMGKAGKDNVNHDAHFYGALFGFIFPGILKPELFTLLIDQIQNKL
ncbi:MAG: rhomboid family intramembrane serine protease [Chitinophagales bacterium]